MLRPPHQRYNRLHVYYFDRTHLPLVEDPDFIGTWIEDDQAILFFHSEKEELIRRICRESGASLIYQAEMGYEDWEAGVKVTAFRTNRLLVRPVWETGESPGSLEEVVLDPSVIFGSGFHPTTRLCLDTLELLFAHTGCSIRSVLDLGTGTGILAIAAARLGATRITAIDHNPLAVQVARANVQANNCTEQIDVRQVDLTTGLVDTGYDLVITNLYKGLLERLFRTPSFWKGTHYLVSGFIPAMEGELLAALPDRSIRMLHRAGKDRWRLWLLGNDQPDRQHH